jgi:hypothetical protein
MIIGIKYDHMHEGFTYPSIMSAFKNHCLELIGQNKNEYKLFIQFLWGIKIYKLDELNNEFLKVKKLLEKNNFPLSEESCNCLDEDEKEDYKNTNNNPLKYFCAVETDYPFMDVFIDTLQTVKEEGEEHISIGSMAVNRPELREEYGWDWPNKIPDEIKNL